ncbi:MAG: MBL fold metallo-hydrolase [Actinomycetia bacterium]|nr:MBL fold metallo-hydrolase [Actinomycetes bacterium]
MTLDLSEAGTKAFAKQISTASLGDHSYIVVVDDQAVAIDIQRDLDRFDDVLSGIDASLVAVFETHIHNDYVSGGKRFADDHGAAYVLPANTGAPYYHTPLSDGETMPVGGWVMRAMHTPGHTFNHTSYVLESPDGPVAIFSGGSMLVGAVGRSDLLGPDNTEQLLNDQYESMHRIASELPDPSLVAPTHGSGSFCAAGNVSATTSTIAQERLQNPALIAPSVSAFGMSQLMGYRQFPAYYRYMAPANLEPLGAPPIDPLPVINEAGDTLGTTIVDVRAFTEFAAGHIPGSLSFEISNDDAVYMGWTLNWGSPLILVGSADQVETVRVHLQRIGWDDVVGRIDPENLTAFADGPLTTIEIVDFAGIGDAAALAMLDVRDPVEHEGGVIPGADLAHLPKVADDPEPYVANGKVFVYCASGYRAGIAASFILAAGGTPAVVKDNLAKFSGLLVTPAV